MQSMDFAELQMPPSPVEGVEIHSEQFQKLWNLSEYNSNPIMLTDLLATAPERMRMKNGISGEPLDILATLEACLKMGRIDRAALIIERSSDFLKLSADEAGRLHTEFLRASLISALKNANEKEADAMHKWYEKHIRPKEVTTFPETIALLVKAALQIKSKARRTRLVQRYMDMIPGETAMEVLSCDHILTPEDLETINEIAPRDDDIISKAQELATNAPAEDSTAATEESNPSVVPTAQKGLGLKSLKAALSLFDNKPAGFDPSKLTYEEQKLRQEKVEEDATLAAIDRWREESADLQKMGLDTALQTKSLGARMWKWQEILEKRIKDQLVALDLAEKKSVSEKTADDNELCTYGPFLRYLSHEKLAAITILTTMQTITSFGVDRGVPMANIVMAVAKNIEDESVAEQLQRTMGKKAYEEFTENVKKGGMDLSAVMRNKHTRKQLTDSLANIVKKDSDPTSKWDDDWSVTIKTKLGAFLLSALFETAKLPVSVQNQQTGERITQIQPAFSHTQQFRIGKRTGILLCNPALVTALQKEPVHSLLAKHLPMLIPPEPWSKFNRGGFVTQSAKVVRIKNNDKYQRYYQEAAIERGDMEQIFKGLEVLGKTPWKINKNVYDVMLQAWNSGEAIADFPPAEPKLEAGPEPEQSRDPAERRRWLRALKSIENTKSAMHSIRCFTNFQLEIARAFRDETFYFPHNVDFRGRAYPIPPYLNHMGADHCRGLLKFGVGRELGARGLKWLRVHISNLAGYDKASLTEREQYTIDHMDDIRDSVANPLGGKKWWLKAEDPWQCLAGCFEIVAAMDSPDPEKYVSYLPVHQDGTCNGLQHYAALGGDAWGAAQVNLEPGDRPADVYSAVADLVKADIKRDVEKGDPCAKWLDGKITRKVVKQTVMTNVYGVTFVGATQQVKKQLVAAHPDIPQDDDFNASTLSSYVARRIFAALGTMFKGAHDIQYWLSECASRITSSLAPEQLDNIDRLAHNPARTRSDEGRRLTRYEKDQLDAEEHFQFRSSVVWTTPLRMPVVQPYRTTKSRIISTNLQRISIAEPRRSDPVSKRKQLQGFPPNFIHSLDATHMMLSAIKSDELGLTFAAVHDSFWTHAADIDSMNTVLRDAFIQMHTEDVVGRLREEFVRRYKDSFYLATIKMDTEFADKVLEWRAKVKSGEIVNPYKTLLNNGQKSFKDFSSRDRYQRTQLLEVLLERRRARLLKSSDPAEVEEGKKMVTPISIFEDMRREKGDSILDVVSDPNLDIAGLGEIKGFIATKPRSSRWKDESELAAENEEKDIDSEDAALSASDDVTDSISEGEVEEVEEAEGEEETAKPKCNGGIKGTKSFQLAMDNKIVSTRRVRWVWLPLEFPEVPAKGSFDVRRLRESQYFFS